MRNLLVIGLCFWTLVSIAQSQDAVVPSDGMLDFRSEGFELNIGVAPILDIPIGSEPRIVRQFYKDTDSTDVRVLPKPGIKVGLSGGYNFGNGFYLGTGAYMMHRGWWEFYELDLQPGVTPVTTREIDFRHSIIQLDIPLEVRFQLLERFRIRTGFHLFFNLAENITVTDQIFTGGLSAGPASSGGASFFDVYSVNLRNLTYGAEWAMSFGNFDFIYASLIFQYTGSLLNEDFLNAGGQTISFAYDYRLFTFGLEINYTLIRPERSRTNAVRKRNKGPEELEEIKLF